MARFLDKPPSEAVFDTYCKNAILLVLVCAFRIYPKWLLQPH
jgi:hypothetical protein